jgi:PilZ domain-containing protein
VAYPIEGSWQGASGGSVCRIGDLSLGGCFIYARALPTAGERAEISMRIGDEYLRFPGFVVHVDPAMGFAVEFRELTPEQGNQIQQILDALARS